VFIRCRCQARPDLVALGAEKVSSSIAINLDEVAEMQWCLLRAVLARSGRSEAEKEGETEFCGLLTRADGQRDEISYLALCGLLKVLGRLKRLSDAAVDRIASRSSSIET
jgi:hypothetical protein